MVGSEHYISNAVSTPTTTYVTVANNTRLRASAQGIDVLKARGSRTHITLNDVLIVQNLCFNLLSAAQLMDCGVDLSTDPETRDILFHFTMPNKTRKHIGRAHSKNGRYILDFDIPDCSSDSQELIDLVPLRFEHIHHRDWKHPDERPWVPHHPHPRELALHDPDLDGICRDCQTPTASTSAISGRGLAAIAEAEQEAPPGEGLSHLELETAMDVAFGTEEHPLPGPASQHLRAITTLRRSLPWRKKRIWRDAKQKSFANGALRSRAAHLPGADGAKRRAPPMKGGGEALADGARATLADGEPQLAATPADGAPHLAARQADGALPAKARGLPARTKGGKKRKMMKNRQTCYVWVVNVEARSRAYEVFRLWLAHAHRQSGEKLKIWQSDGAAEFRSKEMQDYLAQKGIEHHVSLPYAHQQQGVAERTNRTLMTKVRALMKQSKLPPTYETYAMHHAVRVHNLLSTMAITGNSSPHVKWTGIKGNTSMLRV
ncbi:unnamed protein product [Closterium sp. NIES-54]